MSAYLNWPDYLVFVILLLAYAMVGVYFGYQSKINSCCRKLFKKEPISMVNVKSTDDVFIGNRTLSFLPIMGSTLASFMSAVALMGNHAEVYLHGIKFWMLFLGHCIAFPITAEIYTPVFYKLGLTSAHEYLELRFSKLVRRLVTLTFEIQMLVYMSVVLYAPSLALSRVTGWHLSIAILSTGLLATFYTALGGIKAVVWTDLIQITVMLIGLSMILIIGTNRVGGFFEVWRIAGEGGRLNILDFNFDPFVRHSTWILAFGGAGMVLSVFATNQTQVQRYLSCKNLKTARSVIHANLPLHAIFLSLQMLVGLISYAIFSGCDPLLDNKISAYDQMFPHLVMELFANIPALRGLFLSTVFAAALSTLSSGINGIACVLLEDVFLDVYMKACPGSKIKQKKFLLIARLLAVMVGLLIIGFAFVFQFVPSGILHISISLFGAIGGPVLTVFTLGILFPFVNKWGSLFGFLASLAAGLIMAIGSLFLKTFVEYMPIPLTNSSCSPTDIIATAINSNPDPPTYTWTFFNLSYLYYTPFCLIVGILFAVPISFCTGS